MELQKKKKCNSIFYIRFMAITRIYRHFYSQERDQLINASTSFPSNWLIDAKKKKKKYFSDIKIQ